MRFVLLLLAAMAAALPHRSQGSCSEGDVRLVVDTTPAWSKGRVEFCHNEVWGTVCDDGWEEVDAQVLCNQLHLGTTGAVAYQGPDHSFGLGADPQPILLDDVACTGSEPSLVDCGHQPIGTHNCQHTEDCGVTCADPPDCLANERQCPTETGWCIPDSKVCDGVTDCKYGEDEVDCPAIVVGLYPGQQFVPENGGDKTPVYYCLEVLSGESRGNFSLAIDIQTSSGSATAGVDYRTFSDSITISLDADHEMSPEGQPMYCGYQYDIVLDDMLVERIEGFNLIAVSPDATNITIQKGRAKIAVQIMDNDIARIDFEQAEYTVGEGDGDAEVCVQLVDGRLSWPVYFRVSSIDGTAMAGLDYTTVDVLPDIGGLSISTNVSLSLGYDATRQCVHIPIIDDGEDEEEEQFLVTLYSPGVKTLAARESVTVTIMDNEEPCKKLGEIRLAGSTNEGEGRVEVCLDGYWGTVCDNNWDLTDAGVVCEQLGFERAESAPCCAEHGRGYVRISLDDVQCFGNEKYLDECLHSAIGDNNCSHSQDAGVKCLGVGPFKAHFSNDTPIVSEGVVEAIFESNKLATGKCRLSTKGSTTKKKCSPGKTVTFDKLKSGMYTLLVIATADETGEEYRLTRSVYVPGDSDACVTTEINDGVSVYRGVVTAEFSTTGTFDSLACKLDGDALSSEQCSSPMTLEGVSKGQHKLIVLPLHCTGSEVKALNVNFSV